MADKLIIGLTGRKRCGKDTLADILNKMLNEAGEKSYVIHFSMPLKQAAKKYIDKDIWAKYLDSFILNKAYEHGIEIDDDETFSQTVTEIFDGNGVAGDVRDEKFVMFKDNSMVHADAFGASHNRECLLKVMSGLMANYCHSDSELPNSFDAPILVKVIDDWMASEDYNNNPGVSIRDIEVILGTYMRAWISPDFWVNACRRACNNIDADTIIIKDVRMDNEASMVMEMGGKVFDIVREGMAKQSDSAHITEAGVSKSLVHAVIQNVNGDPNAGASEIYNLRKALTNENNLSIGMVQ